MPDSSFLPSVAAGFAQLLAAADLGLTWDATGALYSGDWGIYERRLPQSPDRAVVLTLTLHPSPPARAMTYAGLQVRVRCGPDPRDGETVADGIRGVLLGNYPLTLPNGIRIAALGYDGGGPMGRDENEREHFADNYPLRVHNPTAHRT